MQALLSYDQSPPLAAPFRFFLTAPLCGALAGILLIVYGGDALIMRWTPAALALTHAVTAGFMLQAMLGELEQQVISALANAQTVSRNVLEDAEDRLTFGQRLSDRVAAFGGSWAFIIGFTMVLLGWMALNVSGLLAAPFDPFPFILLNLVLSTIAALQAPIIMMSQKRLEQKDRLRAENDYRVNLKAELEIRQLHEKIDHQLARQWERLASIQRIQIEILEEMAADPVAPGKP